VSKPYLAELVWDDAHGSAIDYITLADAHMKHCPIVMQTVGWVLIDDDKGVSIANERCLEDGEECYRGRTFVLRSMVRSLTPFNKPRKSRKQPPAPKSGE
jgi:hypothetical protein